MKNSRSKYDLENSVGGGGVNFVNSILKMSGELFEHFQTNFTWIFDEISKFIIFP